ncbi:MAG TPA: HAD-IC family P-type ATPase, partial [Thermoanaerobaculia bacterium]|nr:HAD-IC family P-type ATPase [Thermoanaerobaculia bacterium]
MAPEDGLSEEEASRRLEEHGPNELAEDEGPGPLGIFWRQLGEPLVLVLVAAAVVSAALWWLGAGGEREPLPYDALVILAIVVLNAVLGFVQEYRAERAVESLKEMAAPESRVRRGGRPLEAPSRELVPGDVLLLEAGDRVAADARVIDGHNLKADEAALTGESVPVSKGTRAVDDPQAELGDRSSMVYTGSVVTYGRGEAVVVATGMATEMGAIAGLLQTATEERTPLQEELARVGRQLGLLVLGVCAVVAAAGLLRAGRLSGGVLVDMFLFGVALAVAAIPEGLPALVTAVLALGVRRMAEANAVVRHLPAVETLGSATVICSDKTGTVTRNEMAVRRVRLAGGRTLEAEEAEDGRLVFETRNGVGDGERASPEDEPELARLLRFAVLNNDAEPAGNGGEGFRGDPTEAGLLRAAAGAGLEPREVRRQYPRRGEVPFSSERKRMTTVHDLDEGPVAVVKGAPEVVLELCDRIRRGGEVEPLDDEAREAILEASEGFAASALRTLAFASRALPAELATRLAADDAAAQPDEVERELVWEGLVGLIDPPREGAAESVERARRAGIRSILVTGDHVATGLAIAREVGIAGEDDRALSGREIEELSDEELREAVREIQVFGRVRPEHKLRIVRALADHGEIVAMTGDGVNDAPALKEADIGVAMGIAGTDVSKEAADMVLADDDYSTLVAAVAEG